MKEITNVREMTEALLLKFNGLQNKTIEAKEAHEFCNVANSIARQVKLELSYAIINRTNADIPYLKTK